MQKLSSKINTADALIVHTLSKRKKNVSILWQDHKWLKYIKWIVVAFQQNGVAALFIH
jgi:hypothetical protein